MPADVVVVFLEYTRQHERTGVAQLRKVVRRAFPRCSPHLLVVDNSLGGDVSIRSAGGYEVIAGDNRVREFTGLEHGLRHLGARGFLSEETPVVLANDTFHRSYGTRYLRGFSHSRVERALRRGGIAAYVDSFPDEVSLLSLRFQSWARTSLLISKYSVWRRLMPLAIEIPEAELFSAASTELFHPQAPLSANYQRYLKWWLYGRGDAPEGFPYEWHSKIDLEATTVGALRAKARCILSEQYLSARAIRMDIPIIAVAGRPLWERGRDRAMSFARRWLYPALRPKRASPVT